MTRFTNNLVFSTDRSHNKACATCGKNPCCCDSNAVEVLPFETTLSMRLEKKGRGGKTVTVIHELPANREYFTRLTKQLKNHCGTGGSFKTDTIEIQGDQRERAQTFLEGLGFIIKRTGG